MDEGDRPNGLNRVALGSSSCLPPARLLRWSIKTIGDVTTRRWGPQMVLKRNFSAYNVMKKKVNLPLEVRFSLETRRYIEKKKEMPKSEVNETTTCRIQTRWTKWLLRRRRTFLFIDASNQRTNMAQGRFQDCSDRRAEAHTSPARPKIPSTPSAFLFLRRLWHQAINLLPAPEGIKNLARWPLEAEETPVPRRTRRPNNLRRKTTQMPQKSVCDKLCLFVTASHQTGLDTWSKVRGPIKVRIKGRGRSGTSRNSNPAFLCCSLAHLV